MRIQDYLGKITWTAVDKLLFILYGFVTIVQIKVTNDTAAYGLFTMLTALQTWIFIVSDGSALQGIIQFGMDKGNRPKVNTISGVLHISVVMGFSVLIALLHSVLATMFNEPRIAQVALWLPVYCLLTIPRTFCLKLLLRDLQMKQIFWVNFSWFGTMSVLTLWLIVNGSLSNPLTNSIDKFHLLSLIAFTGMLVSSVTAVVLSRGLLGFGMSGEIGYRNILGFGVPQALVGTINNSIRQLDILLLQYFFGVNAVGVYQAAKNLYRVFEIGIDAIYSLVYPAAVRLLSQNERAQFIALLSKAVSFVFVPYVLVVLILELKGTEIVVGFLGSKYQAAAQQFNLLIMGALFLPFIPLSSVPMALQQSLTLLVQVIVSAAVGICVLIWVGIINDNSLFPLGIVAYSFSLSVLLILYSYKTLGLTPVHFLRAVPDSINFIKGFKK